jgi:hypothetical protein
VASTPSCPPIGRTNNLWPKTQDWLHTFSHSTAKQTQTCCHIKGCLPKSRGTYRTRGEGSLVWLLGSSWWGHGNSGNKTSFHVGWPMLCCLSFETWLLPKARQREGEGDRMDGYFYMAPNQKVWWQKMVPNNPGSNGREETSPGPLLLKIKVTYIILKNKPLRNWPHKPEILMICIGFYCDMKPTSKTMAPWLVRTTLSMVLYKLDVCMNLFNMASPNFDEWGGTICIRSRLLKGYVW